MAKAKMTIEELADELAINPDSPILLCEYSQKLLKDGRISMTIDVCNHLLKLVPDHGLGRATLAEALARYDERDKALTEYRAALIEQDTKVNKDSFMRAIKLFFEVRCFEEALLIAERAYKCFPKFVPIQCFYGIALCSRSEDDAAYDLFASIVAVDPKCKELCSALLEASRYSRDPRIKVLLAEQYMVKNLFEPAKIALANASLKELDSDTKEKIARLRLLLIEKFTDQGKLRDALELVEKLDLPSGEVEAIRAKISANVWESNESIEEIRTRSMALGTASGDKFDSFVKWTKGIQWLAEIGETADWLKDFVWDSVTTDGIQESAEYWITLVQDFDDYPVGDDEYGVQEYLEELGELQERLLEKYPEVHKAMDRVYKSVFKAVSKDIGYDEDEDHYHAPNAVAWNAAYTTSLIAGFLAAEEPVPEILKLAWFFLAAGHVLCGYENYDEDEVHEHDPKRQLICF